MRNVAIEGKNLEKYGDELVVLPYSEYKHYIQNYKQRERSWFQLWGFASCSAFGVCKLESQACVM